MEERLQVSAARLLHVHRKSTDTYTAAIYVSIFSNQLTVNLPAQVTGPVEAAGLPSSSVTALFAAITNGTRAALESVPGMHADILAVVGRTVKDAYSMSFKTVYLSSLGFGGLAVIASFFATDVDTFLTNFVNKTISGPKGKGGDVNNVMH